MNNDVFLVVRTFHHGQQPMGNRLINELLRLFSMTYYPLPL
jgi:hypothetical protein